MKKFAEYLILFLIITTCLYFVCTGLFGETGYFYNQSLEALLVQLEMKTERAQYELDNLLKYENTLSTKEGIRDTAIELGYYFEDDKVFFIENGELQDSIEVDEISSDVHLFSYLEKHVCLIIAASVSLFVCLVSYFVNKVKSNVVYKPAVVEETKFNDDLIE